MRWFPINLCVKSEWRITLGRETSSPNMFLVRFVHSGTVKNIMMRRDSPRICEFDPQKHLSQKPRILEILKSESSCVDYNCGVIELDMGSEEETDCFFWYYENMLIGDQPKLQLLVESCLPKNIDNLYCLILNLKGHEIVKVGFQT
jgi:hypothetical protein